MHILQAAYLHNGIIHTLPRPYRHPDIFLGLTGVSGGYTAGFITSEGKFVNREIAYRIAQQAGQLLPGADTSFGELRTEDMW